LFAVKQFPITQIKCEIVVFDADKAGVSVHTYGDEYQWGHVSKFKTLELTPSLRVDVPREWGWFMQARHGNELFGVFNGEEWEVRMLGYEQDDWYDRTSPIYWSDISPEFQYFHFEGDSILFYPSREEVGEYPYGAGQSMVYYPKKNIWLETMDSFGHVQDTAFFTFADGSTGFMSFYYYFHSPFGRGHCGSCEHDHLTIYRLDGIKKHVVFELDANMGNIQVSWPTDWGINEHVSPDLSTIKWDDDKKNIELHLYDEHDGEEYKLVFAWDNAWKPFILSLKKIAD
jgi:hypothetical protein